MFKMENYQKIVKLKYISKYYLVNGNLVLLHTERKSIHLHIHMNTKRQPNK